MNQPASKRFIVLKVARSLLAISLDRVLKVVTCPPPLNQQLRSAGMAQIGHRTLAILHLQPQASLESSLESTPGRFLVITQTHQEELCGILVDEPPNLIEIPAVTIQPVPASYYQRGLADWVRQIAILPQKEATTTLLLLDVDRALSNTSGLSKATSAARLSA